MVLTAAYWCALLCVLSLILGTVAERVAELDERRHHVHLGQNSFSRDTTTRTVATWNNATEVEAFFEQFPTTGTKQEKFDWLEEAMKNVESIPSVNALHKYFSKAGDEGLIGGPYESMIENNQAKEVVHWGLKKYNGIDWKEVMNDEKLTAEPKGEEKQFAGATASLIHQVYPPHEKFVILLLAWMPMGKHPKISMGGVGVAHTHGQAACSFKFLKAVQNCGNTFYDISGNMSDGTGTMSAKPNVNPFTGAKIFEDGQKHVGSCEDPNYKPILLTPDTGRQYIESDQILGENVGYIQDELGAHSIDNLNTEEIAYSIHIYYPPYAKAWAFHQHVESNAAGCSPDMTQKCKARQNPNVAVRGWKNCVHPHGGTCRGTNMEAYLKEAKTRKDAGGTSASQVIDNTDQDAAKKLKDTWEHPSGTVTSDIYGDPTLEPKPACMA